MKRESIADENLRQLQLDGGIYGKVCKIKVRFLTVVVTGRCHRRCQDTLRTVPSLSDRANKGATLSLR
jgi:hypothetical protein